MLLRARRFGACENCAGGRVGCGEVESACECVSPVQVACESRVKRPRERRDGVLFTPRVADRREKSRRPPRALFGAMSSDGAKLVHAAGVGNDAKVKRLLKAKVDVNSTAMVGDWSGVTALRAACHSAHAAQPRTSPASIALET